MQENDSKKKKVKILRPSRLVFLIVLLASNAFAWFIYATKVDSDVSVHVRSWNVVFEAGEHEVTDMVNINVSDIYPGMQDYHYELKAYNHSEVSATISYEIMECRLLSNYFKTVEGKQEAQETILPTDPYSADLADDLENDYPFSIEIGLSDTTIAQGNGEETFSIDVTWPYESNQDDIDTQWGVNAYNYKQSNPTAASIAMRIKITITQNNV